jgi:tetratricopeptide (TPR) repeat protein
MRRVVQENVQPRRIIPVTGTFELLPPYVARPRAVAPGRNTRRFWRIGVPACAAAILLQGCAALWPGTGEDIAETRDYASYFEAELRGQELPDDMFRLEDAIALYELGLSLDAEGRTSEAADAFEQAGRLWPDGLGTWVALAETTDRLGERDRFDAAAFMVQRTWLHDGEEAYVQREVNRSLRDYLQRQRRGDLDGARQRGDQTLELAERLADFYDWQAARTGRYQPERIAYFDISAREIPAVVVSGAGLGYLLAP